MREHAKAIVAFLTLTGTWLGSALADGNMSPVEWVGVTGVLAGTFAVYQVSNGSNAENPGD